MHTCTYAHTFEGSKGRVSLCWKESESESCSIVSYSLRAHGLYPWNSPGQSTEVGSLSLLQGIFPTQGMNSGLPHCRWILYQLSHKGSPKTTGVGSLSLLQGIFPTQGSKPGLPHCSGFFTSWATREAPRILKWVAYSFSSRFSQPRNWMGVFCIAGGFFTNWAIRKAQKLEKARKLILSLVLQMTNWMKYEVKRSQVTCLVFGDVNVNREMGFQSSYCQLQCYAGFFFSLT